MREVYHLIAFIHMIFLMHAVAVFAKVLLLLCEYLNDVHIDVYIHVYNMFIIVSQMYA